MFRRMTRERYLSDAELERFMSAVRGGQHRKAAKALLGHESAETTAIYAHVTPQALVTLANTFPVVV